MSFTVVWNPSAERDLAELWMNSTDRESVAAAADEIDAGLRRDAPFQGESRGGNSRILVVPPLAILFDVNHDDRMVSVWAVLRWGRPPDESV